MANEVSIHVTAQDDTSKTFKQVSDSAHGLGKVLGDVGKIAGGFLAANVIGAGVSAFSNFIGGSVREATRLGESLNAVSKIFGESAGTILDWGEKNATSFGLSQQAFNELATPMGAILRNLGFSSDQVADQTINLTKRAADLASVFNTDVNDALGAINSALRGEGNPIERYGVSVNAATVELRALADTGKKSATQLTDNEKAAARLALIFDQTASSAGDFAQTSNQLANATRIQQARQEELQATIGTKLAPIMLKLTELKLKLVEVIAEKVIPVLEALYAKHWPAVSKALADVALILKVDLWPAFKAGVDTIFPLIQAFFGFILEHKSLLIAAIAGIGAAIVLALGPVSLTVLAISGAIALVGVFSRSWDDIARSIVGAIDTIISAYNRIPLLPNISRLGQAPAPDVYPDVYPDIPRPGYAHGTSFVPRTGLALLHRGEAVIPAANNMSGANGMTVNLYVAGSVRSDRDLVQLIYEAGQRGDLRGLTT